MVQQPYSKYTDLPSATLTLTAFGEFVSRSKAVYQLSASASAKIHAYNDFVSKCAKKATNVER